MTHALIVKSNKICKLVNFMHQNNHLASKSPFILKTDWLIRCRNSIQTAGHVLTKVVNKSTAKVKEASTSLRLGRAPTCSIRIAGGTIKGVIHFSQEASVKFLIDLDKLHRVKSNRELVFSIVELIGKITGNYATAEKIEEILANHSSFESLEEAFNIVLDATYAGLSDLEEVPDNEFDEENIIIEELD